MAPHLNVLEVGSSVRVRECEKSEGDQWVDALIVSVPEKKSAPEFQSNDVFDVATKQIRRSIKKSDMVYSKKCIFWRFLRPEFLKHRGQTLLENMSVDDVVTSPPAIVSQMDDLDIDISSMPPMNPPLKKAPSSTYTTLSSDNQSSDGGATDRMYYSFLSLDNNSEEERSSVINTGTVKKIETKSYSMNTEEVPVSTVISAMPTRPVALSSDALSEFSRDDPDALLHNENVKIATDILVTEVIPAMVRIAFFYSIKILRTLFFLGPRFNKKWSPSRKRRTWRGLIVSIRVYASV